MNVMVCVTTQQICERLIKAGHELIKDREDTLYIIHIAHYDFYFSGMSEEGEALDYLYEKALEAGAALQVVRSNNVVNTIAHLIEENQIDRVILGKTREIGSTGVKEKLEKNLNTSAIIQVVD